MSKKQSILFGVVLLVLALVWTLLQRPSSSQDLTQSPAPDFQLVSPQDGQPIKLSHFQGKVRLVVFWATWCPPCLAEIPTLISLQKELGPRGLQIIGISLDDGPEAVLSMHNKVSFNYPIVMGTQETVESYGNFPGVPTSFLINRQGKIISMIPGMVPEAQLKELIETALSS